MAEQLWTEQETLQRLGISAAELDHLVARGRLQATERGGERRFSSEEIDKLEQAISAGKEWISREQAVEILGGDSGRLDALTRDGDVRRYRFGETVTFDAAELRQAGGLAGQEEEAEGLDLFATEVAATKPDPAEPEGEEEAFFDFTEELSLDQEEPAEEAVPKAVPEPPAAEEEDMPTEVLELGGEGEVDEADLLSDILDMEEAEAGEEIGLEEEEEIPVAEEVEEVTADIIGEDTEDVEVAEEATAEITTLEEDIYEEEELGEILTAEEEAELPGIEMEETPEFEIPRGVPVVAEARAPVGVGVVLLLVVTFIVMILGGLFVRENAVRPEYRTALLEKLNPFRGP